MKDVLRDLFGGRISYGTMQLLRTRKRMLIAFLDLLEKKVCSTNMVFLFESMFKLGGKDMFFCIRLYILQAVLYGCGHVCGTVPEPSHDVD